MLRYCPNCGTEVDGTAVFCPTCGQPIDQAAETEIPPAPAWPEPARPPERAAPAEPGTGAEPAMAAEPAMPPHTAMPAEPGSWDEPPPPAAAEPSGAAPDWDAARSRIEPTRVVTRPAEPDEPGAARPAPAAAVPPARAGEPGPAPTSVNLPFTTPLTLSGWLIGGGSLLGALGMLISLFDGFVNPIELVMLVALLAIAATVFLADAIPDVPNLRLVTLAVVLVAFGVGLDRIGFGAAGVGELLLFLGAAAAAIGAIILELGRDQPMGITR
jgi:hypothetical protein